MKGFGSDNHSGVHPQLLDSIARANREHAPSYGTDEWTQRSNAIFRDHFGKDTQSYFVFNGTGANVTALRTMMRPWEACLCSSVSHLLVDECGAPEFFAGKLISLPTSDGKLTLSQLQEALIRKGDQHYAQIKVVSITQPTELGTCYTLKEISEICEWAHRNQLKVHMDGARISNAVHFLKSSFREMVTDMGVDVLSFGGTKNGLLFGECVVFPQGVGSEGFSYVRKQTAQLPSKTRFVASQFETYLGSNLWSEISAHSHAMALKLRESTAAMRGVQITQATESNAVFAQIPQKWVKPLREKYFFYVWDEKTFECRWMTSWDTEARDIQEFSDLLKKVQNEIPPY